MFIRINMDISKLKKSEVTTLQIGELEVFIKKFSLKGREVIDEIISNFIKESNQNNYAVGLKSAVILASVCDESGKLILKKEDIDDIDSDIATAIYNKSVEYNKLFKSTEDRAQDFLATQA